MNFAPPVWLKEAAEEALNHVATNHYSHPKGRIRLREALKARYSPMMGRDLDVETEILVTSGANEGTLSVHPVTSAALGLTHDTSMQDNTLFSSRSWSKETR